MLENVDVTGADAGDGDALRDAARRRGSWLVEPALAFDGVTFDHADLVLAGLLDGSWQRFVAELRLALAAERDVPGAGPDDGRDELPALASAYRRERGLLSSEDLRSWLAVRRLDADDFKAHLHRVVRLRAAREHPPGAATAPPAGDVSVEAALRAEAILSGTLRRCGELLVTWAAAASWQGTLHEPPQPDDAACERASALRRQAADDHAAALAELHGTDVAGRAGRLATLERSWRDFVRAQAGAPAIGEEIRRRRLEWQRVRWQAARVRGAAVGREVALCVRDGMSLAEAAALAGAEVRRHARRFDELDAELGGILLATPPGELGGPFPSGDGFLLVWVDAREAPREDDDELRTLAQEVLVRDALERWRVGKVSWADGL